MLNSNLRLYLRKMNYRFIKCPKCGYKQFLKVTDNTYIKAFPAFCRKCSEETIINYRPEHLKSQSNNQKPRQV